MKSKLSFVLCLFLLLSLFNCAGNGDDTGPDDGVVETTVPLSGDTTETADDTTAADTGEQPDGPQLGELSYKTEGFELDYIMTDADSVIVQKTEGNCVILIMRYYVDSSPDRYKIGIYDVTAQKYIYLSEEIESEKQLYIGSKYSSNDEFSIYTSVDSDGESEIPPTYYLLSENDGEWTLTKMKGEVPDFDECGMETAISPDGSLFSYWESVELEEKKGYYDNRTFIRDLSGNETEILPTDPWIDMYTATAYKPRFFIDNDNLVLGVPYKGYGIYTISTDTFSYLPYEDINISPVIYKNGIIYSIAPDARGYYTRVFRDNGDGVPIEILPDAETAEYLKTSYGLNLYSYCENGEYNGYFYTEGITDGEKTTRVYSLDLELIAEVSTVACHYGDEDENLGFIYCPDRVILIY